LFLLEIVVSTHFELIDQKYRNFVLIKEFDKIFTENNSLYLLED